MSRFVVGIPSVTKTIKIKRPGREEEQFTADIRVRDLDDQDELEKKRVAGELKGHAHMREDVLAIGGCATGAGDDVSSSDDATLIDSMFKDPYARMGLMRAWHEVQSGLPEAVEKN